MKALQLIDRLWVGVERFVLSVTTILMSLMLVGNAVSRYFFNKSWPFTEEVGKMGVLVLTFMGLGYAARKGLHIEMSGFYDLLNKKLQRILRIFINLISFIILGVCTFLAFKYVQHMYELNQVSTILRLPMYLITSVIPIGFFLAATRYFIDFILVILNKEREKPDETEQIQL